MAGLDATSAAATTMNPYLIGAGVGLDAINFARSWYDQNKAEDALNQLGRQPLPRYSVNPAINRLYASAQNQINSPIGLTAAEQAQYKTNIARGLNTQAYNARVGGGSSRAVTGALNANALGAYGNMQAQDANLRRQYVNSAYSRLLGAANTMQNTQDKNTQMDWNYRLQREQALGNAIRSNRNMQYGMLGNMGNDLMTAGVYSGMNPRQVGGGGSRKWYNPNAPINTLDYNEANG